MTESVAYRLSRNMSSTSNEEDQDGGYATRNEGFRMTESVAYRLSRNMSSTSNEDDQDGGYATIV